jgi:PAS domain S-box-containing protein
VYHSMDAAASLEESAAEVEQALAFADRTGNAFVTASMTVYRQITRALRGETSAPGSLTDASFADDDFVASLGPNQTAAANYHSARAVVAAVFGDLDALDTHSAATLGLLPFVDVTQVCAQGRLQRCLALARRARRADPADREPMLAEFAGHRDWLARRADEAPVNFGHVRTWLDAERAWAAGDLDQALRGFDTAQREVTTRSRPLHRAMIAESRARCQLDGGLEHGGRQALAEARQLYLDWGATGKVTELEREFPFLRGARTTWANEGPRTFHATMGTGGSSDALDILALLRATQALTSETDLTRLRDRVGEVLTAMTGATAVRLLLRDHDSNDWFLPDPDGGGVPVTDAAEGGLVPLTAFRYAERTGEPLLIPDAVHDDRFARDPYLQGLDECALLVVPILARGAPRGMLLLENRLARGAFSPDRIDAVMLVAGQLAVSLENALAERFRSLVQRSADLTLVCNRQGVISYASAAAIELAGVRETHLLGRAAVDLVPVEDRAGLLERLARVTPGLPETMTCRVVRAGGPHRWADVTITDLTGEPAVGGLMLHLRDVTERQRLEAELRHAQKLESVGQLSAGIAHEINTPIQFMTANLAFLTEAFQDLTGDAGAPAAADDELADLLTEIPQAIADTLEGAERVATIVRAMKAFGDAGDEDRTDVDLNEAIRNTLVVAAAELRDVADVETELGELPPAWCTPGDVNQILLNLVLNAAHAIGDAVAGTDRRGTLTVRSRQGDGDVVVEVEDTGTGISPEIADRVFDQFFTTRPEGAGTGQGLSLAHTLVVDRYGGTITFESTPGTGTTFTVRLPTRA